MMGDMAGLVGPYRDELIALRRAIHQEPELAFEERGTAARVQAFLTGRPGVALRTGVGGTGVVATVRPAPGPSVLLRVDMDGLPIQEATAAPYASRTPGVMHACGHDGHTAMGAVATRLLAERRPAGTVHVLFQPAEEGQGGAEAVARDGVMDGVDRVIGIHLWNELAVGTIGVKAGPLMASVDRLTITITGRGGHGAAPHRSADPIVAAAHVVTALQTVVSREVSPLSSAVVTIGSVRGGTAFNVIPEDVVLTGTLRTFDAALRRSMPERLQRIAGGVAQGLGCRAAVQVETGSAAVVNDPSVAEIARRAAAAVVGDANVVAPESTMGGEDVSVYLDRAPGCFVFIGSANAARGLSEPHHSPRFDFDEDALAVGCESLVRAAELALAG
jgi:amidohydrolase